VPSGASGIYILLDKATGEPIYVGMTTNVKKRQYDSWIFKEEGEKYNIILENNVQPCLYG
jgi:excinuclease UvrABC nuclease subunit